MRVSLIEFLVNYLFFVFLLQDGSDDIKNHKWFRGVDWQGLLDKTVAAPIVPPYVHPGDTGNFEKYPEVTDDEASQGDPYRSLFTNF